MARLRWAWWLEVSAIDIETGVWWVWWPAFGWLSCYGFAGFVVGTWWVLFCFFYFGFLVPVSGVWVGFGWRLGGVWVGVGCLDLGPVVVEEDKI